MVQNRERQPLNQLRLFVGYGPSERLRLLVGHALIYQNMNAHAIWDYVVAPEFRRRTDQPSYRDKGPTGL